MSRYKIKDANGDLFETADINVVLSAKGLKAVPKHRFNRRPCLRDRICDMFPSRYSVAHHFNLLDLPPETSDQPSSQEATVWYIKQMYFGHLGTGHFQPRIENGQVYF